MLVNLFLIEFIYQQHRLFASSESRTCILLILSTFRVTPVLWPRFVLHNSHFYRPSFFPLSNSVLISNIEHPTTFLTHNYHTHIIIGPLPIQRPRYDASNVLKCTGCTSYGIIVPSSPYLPCKLSYSNPLRR